MKKLPNQLAQLHTITDGMNEISVRAEKWSEAVKYFMDEFPESNTSKIRSLSH